MDKLFVPKTIIEQIGGHALMMIGAKNLAGDKNSLSMKIGANAKRVTHIKITLNGMDLYDMDFFRCRNGGRELLKEVNGLYFDQLNETIEHQTELYTKL